jgi:hypothetical protein
MPDILVDDSVFVLEHVATENIYYSVFDITDVSDAVTVVMESFFRVERVPSLPTSKGSGSFSRRFSTPVTLRVPAATGLGYLGAILSQRVPTASASATMSVASIGFTCGDTRVPLWSMTGGFGGVAEATVPVWELSAEFYSAGTFSLDAVVPVWSLSAEFLYPYMFSLNRQAPAWIGQGTISLVELSASLDARIPGAFQFLGIMYENGGFMLNRPTPVRRLESSMYSGGMELEAVVPAWMVASAHDAEARDATRFTAYVLKYYRP